MIIRSRHIMSRRFKPENYAPNFPSDNGKEIFVKRKEIIKLAIAWEGEEGEGKYVSNEVWKYRKDPSFVVSLCKYGKEFYRDGDRKNINDMRPSVVKNGEILQSVKGGFNDIFRLLEMCKKRKQDKVLRAFAVLFLRNVFLIDHEDPSGGYYIYEPNEELVQFICDKQQEYEGVPMEVYIHYLDAIALNEDVKYYTKGKLTSLKRSVGRENNMRTYLYYICCLLSHIDWSEYIYKLITSRGVAPITNKDIAKSFPEFFKIGYKPRKSKVARKAEEAGNSEKIVKAIDCAPPIG